MTPHPHPQNVEILISRICECNLTRQRGMRLQIEFSLIISWSQNRGGYCGLPGVPDVITRFLTRGREMQKRRSGWWGVRGRKPASLALKVEEGRSEPPEPLEAERARKWILSWSSQKECGPANSLMLAQWDLSETSDLQNCKIANLWFKPWCVW